MSDVLMLGVPEITAIIMAPMPAINEFWEQEGVDPKAISDLCLQYAEARPSGSNDIEVGGAVSMGLMYGYAIARAVDQLGRDPR